jgi:hypothetical protein
MEVSLSGNSHQRRIQLRKLKREYRIVQRTYDDISDSFCTYTLNGYKGPFKYKPVRI